MKLVLFQKKQKDWLREPYVSVLAVNIPEELEIIRAAVSANLSVYVWKDVIPSEMLENKVIECVVGIAIGPADSDELRLITGNLPLYGAKERD